MIRAALVVALCLIAAPVAAEPPPAPPGSIQVPEEPAAIAPVEGWAQVEAPAVVDGPVIALSHAGGAVAALTIALAPNPEAWREQTRAAYARTVIAGFRAIAGMKVTRTALQVIDGVPVLDLAMVRRKGTPRHVAVRILLYRTRSIMLAAEGAEAALVASAARALIPAPAPPSPSP